jgi:hypothetical protein
MAPDAVCLINPWVRTESSRADALLKTYYWRRLLTPGFWKRLLTGRVALASFLEPIRSWQAVRSWRTAQRAEAPSSEAFGGDLPSQLLGCLRQFDGQIWTVLSGNDLTAAETDSLVNRDEGWRRLLQAPAVSLLRVAGADHTFTDEAHWSKTIEWLVERCHSMKPNPTL